MCIVKGIFLVEEIGFFLQYLGSYKRHISETFRWYSVYSEGHFSSRGIKIFLLIAASVRGISTKRFVVHLCMVKGIFLGEEIEFCYISRLLSGAYLRNASFFLCQQ